MSMNAAKDIAKEVAMSPEKPLMGQFPDTDRAIGHPIHPAMVHWPIAFLSTSLAIWSLPLAPIASFQGIIGKAPAVSAGFASHFVSSTASGGKAAAAAATTTGLVRLLPPMGALPGIAHYSALLGLAMAMTAIVTGAGEGYALLKGQVDQKGSWSQVAKDAWALKDQSGKKAWLTIEHASLNDLVAGIVAWNTWKSFKSPDFAITRAGAVASVIGLGLLFYAASLGGKLVYEHGVGVQRQGVNKQNKQE